MAVWMGLLGGAMKTSLRGNVKAETEMTRRKPPREGLGEELSKERNRL